MPRHLDASLRRMRQTIPGKVLGALSLGKRRTNAPTEEILVCERFEPEELATQLGNFVGTLFGKLAGAKHAEGWCEDTPANALHIPFLLKLFPCSRHIDMVRYPCGAAYSYTQHAWAPSDFRLPVQLLVHLYEKIISVLEQLSDRQKQAVELCDESLSCRKTCRMRYVTGLALTPLNLTV